MFGLLLVGLVILVMGVVMPAIADTKTSTYGSELENYINRHRPTDTADVERLTREYDQKAQRDFL